MSDTPEEIFLDMEAMELVDGCISSSVPIFIMAQYAKCVQQDPLISERYLVKLSKKMLDNWSKIVHNHKHLITEEDLRNVEFSGDYPKRTDFGVQQIRYAYYGTKRRNHS
tara:strand:- start:585 stop:914 length:330 start_codon:yes stop_codon:yes gene_type:complete